MASKASGLRLNSEDVHRKRQESNSRAHYLFLIYGRILGEMARSGTSLADLFHFHDSRETQPTDEIKLTIIKELRSQGFRIVQQPEFGPEGRKPWTISWEGAKSR